MADLKLPEMVVVYVLGTGHTMRTNIASGNQTDRIIQVCTSLPNKREGIKNKVPPTPLKAKVGSTFCRKTNTVITTFIVASGLKITLVNVSGKVSNKIQRKREIFDPQIEESLVVAHARLRWLYSDRHNQVRGQHFSNFPPDRQGSIGYPFQNGIRDKFKKGLTASVVGEESTRG